MKNLKIIISAAISILLIFILYYIATINPSLNRARDIKKLRDAVKITYNSNEIDMKYKNEFIDIIERGEKASGWSNLPTTEFIPNIDFYNKENVSFYSLIFYPKEYEIGFSGREKVILEKDRERFLEIINYNSSDN